jgi:hypothetical protein
LWGKGKERKGKETEQNELTPRSQSLEPSEINYSVSVKVHTSFSIPSEALFATYIFIIFFLLTHIFSLFLANPHLIARQLPTQRKSFPPLLR